MNTAPIKTCDHCQHTGTMPTFRDGETICIDCMEKSANMSRGKYLALLAEVEQLKKGVELRDQQNADLHDMIADVHQERDQLKTEIAHLQIEVNNLRGLKPEIPPMPGEDWPRELPRYILRENGPRRPRSVPHKDGYWTPWYLANRLYEELERERKAAKTACANWGEMKRERDQLKEKLSEEERCHVMTINQRDNAESHADRLADGIAKALGVDIGEHSSANCPWNSAFFAINEFNLAQHDAEVIARVTPDFLDPTTNNGDLRTDAEFRMGWNACRDALAQRAEQLRQQAKEDTHNDA